MTTSFRIKMPAVLVLIITLASGLPDSVFGGCYCMMESKTISAAYNKTGFQQFTYTNGPVQIYLHSLNIAQSEVHRSQSDSSSFWQRDWSQLAVYETQYSLTSENLSRGQAAGCQMFTLPYTRMESQDGNGSQSDTGTSLTWKRKSSMRIVNDTTVNDVCDGAWHRYYSDQSPESGSECDGYSTIGSWSEDLRPSNWPSWGQISLIQNMEALHVEKSGFSEDNSGDGYSSKANGFVLAIAILSDSFTDAELRKQVLARLPAWPDTWSGGSGIASYLLNGEHICGGGSKMKYRLKVPNSEKLAIYKLEYALVTQVGTNVISTTMKENITGNGDPVNPAIGETHEVDMPGEGVSIYATAPEVVEVVYPSTGSAGNAPGTGGPRKGQ